MNTTQWWRSRGRLALPGFAAVAAFFLHSEHRAHLIEWLPWLILLACPLLYIFMHRGHSKNGHHHD
jgi:hypothetical protein